MNEHKDLDANAAFLLARLQALEAARSALANDIATIRLAILQGSQMLTLNLGTLAGHLRQTHLLLIAAKQACEEILRRLPEERLM